MLIPRSVLDALAATVGETRSDRLRVVYQDIDLDPLDLVRAGAASFGQAFFFSSPVGRSIGALGAAWNQTASGEDRLLTLDAHVAELDRATPVLVGFSFDPEGPGLEWEGFAAASAVVPEVGVVRESGRSRLFLSIPAGSDGRALLTLLSTLESPTPTVAQVADFTLEPRPPPADYVGIVDEAVATIRSGAVSKVVLARSVVARTPQPVDGFELVARLRAGFPGCYAFGWQQGDAVFLGASPELLVSRKEDLVMLSPLAGTAPRGGDPEEDRRIGEELLESTKDRFEHRVVVDDVLDRIAPLATDLRAEAAPHLLRFPNVQHLATAITGKTAARVLEIASALHPTAAVGGLPRSEALALIKKLEGLDRGWYSGGIGWLDPGGDGEVVIGLRCGLVRDDQVVLFAGNGIVGDSNPAAELAETRLKLRALLDLLT